MKAVTASHSISSNSPSGDRKVPRCILSLFSFISCRDWPPRNCVSDKCLFSLMTVLLALMASQSTVWCYIVSLSYAFLPLVFHGEEAHYLVAEELQRIDLKLGGVLVMPLCPLIPLLMRFGNMRCSRNPWFLFHFFPNRTWLEIRDQSGQICTILCVIFMYDFAIQLALCRPVTGLSNTSIM
jgi:hypothetical protein